METKILRNINIILLSSALLIAVVFGGFDPIVVFSVELLLAGAFLVILWGGYDCGIRLRITPVTILITLLWVWMAVSAIISPSKFISLYGFFLLSSSIAIFWILSLLSTPILEHTWSVLRIILVIVGVVLAIYAFTQIPIGGVYPRAFFAQKNSLGAFMNILTLPIAAYYLMLPSGWKKKTLIPILFILFFTICITNGYGVSIGFCVGFATLLWLVRKDCARQDLEMLLLLVLASFLLDRLFAAHGVMLTPIMSHTISRLVIWSAAWHLLQNSPWYGTGIYNFILHYASYMPINDHSAGQYAHNDYLQFWIELGYPGLILIVGLIVAVFYTFVRWLNTVGMKAQNRIEGVGLFAGLMAVAIHSFVTYNFYVLPIILLFGLVLARFDRIATLESAHAFLIRPSKIMTLKGFRLIVLSVFLMFGVWLGLLVSSQLYYRQGLDLLAQGKLRVAGDYLNTAAKLYDTYRIEYSRARLYALLLSHTTNLPKARRRQLYLLALGDIKRARKLDSLRALGAVRAELIQSSPDIVGPGWLQLAINNYQSALAKNPRLMAVRMKYIKLLLNNYRYKLAEKALSDGILYSLRQPILRDFFSHILVTLRNKHKQQL